MKYELIDSLRSFGLLRGADAVLYWLNRLLSASSNREFVSDNPDFTVPPLELAFDAYHHVNWSDYRKVGLLHASVFADIIKQYHAEYSLSVLEWGCGPGRIIRHLESLLGRYDVSLFGSDYNNRSIEWCKSNLSGMTFVNNSLLPPLPFSDAKFDVTYNFSVFTHLSEEAQIAWTKELWRILKPGGMLICSTHGDYYRYLLTRKEERLRYANGDLVVQGGYGEGKKWFFAIHPPSFVKNVLLRDFENLQHHSVEGSLNMHQDIWIARKPAGTEC